MRRIASIALVALVFVAATHPSAHASRSARLHLHGVTRTHRIPASAAPEFGSQPDLLALGEGRVGVGHVGMHQSPKHRSPTVAHLRYGELLAIVGRVRTFYHVRRADGSSGYVTRHALKPARPGA